jgi:hypothetical protein
MVKSAGANGDNPGFARVAGYSLEQIDAFLGNMGHPTGVACYTPHHATGEEFLHDYLGMIGVPMDIFPDFPSGADMILLTEQAKFDPDIISKIKSQLTAGKSVCITTGFVKAMKGKGIEDLIEVDVTGNQIPVRSFTGASGPGAFGRGGGGNMQADRDILIPEMKYYNILTHDAWGDSLVISAGGTTYPMVLSSDYSKGELYILTVPIDYADLYALPGGVLNVIRQTLGKNEPIRIDGAPSHVSLFRYDNGTFIVRNFNSTSSEVNVSVAGGFTKIHDLVADKDYTGRAAGGRGGFGGFGPTSGPTTNTFAAGGGFAGAPAPTFGRGPTTARSPRMVFTFTVPPHSYMAFRADK